MSGQIRMSPEQLKSRANRYGQGSQQIDQVLRDLTNLQNELRAEKACATAIYLQMVNLCFFLFYSRFN